MLLKKNILCNFPVKIQYLKILKTGYIALRSNTASFALYENQASSYHIHCCLESHFIFLYGFFFFTGKQGKKVYNGDISVKTIVAFDIIRMFSVI